MTVYIRPFRHLAWDPLPYEGRVGVVGVRGREDAVLGALERDLGNHRL